MSDVRPPGAPYGITSRTTTPTFDGTLCSYRLFADGKELNLTIAYATHMNGKAPADYIPTRDAEISSHQTAGTTIDVVELPAPPLSPMRQVKMVRQNKGTITALSGLLGPRFVSVALAATDGVPSSVDPARSVTAIAAAIVR